MKKNARPEMSKGSWYRPVNKKKYDENYDKIFGDKDGNMDTVQEDSQQVCNVDSQDEIEKIDEKSKEDNVQGSDETGNA